MASNMFYFLIMLASVAAFGSEYEQNPPPNSLQSLPFQPAFQLPVKLGDRLILDVVPNSVGAIVREDTGAVHFVHHTWATADTVLEIAPPGEAERLIEYQGIPYIVRSDGALMAIDPRPQRIRKSMIPFAVARSVHHWHVATGAGVVGGLIAFLDSLTAQYLAAKGFGIGKGFLSGFCGFYLIDNAVTFAFRRPVELGVHLNLFTTRLAPGWVVKDITPMLMPIPNKPGEQKIYDYMVHLIKEQSALQKLRKAIPEVESKSLSALISNKEYLKDPNLAGELNMLAIKRAK